VVYSPLILHSTYLYSSGLFVYSHARQEVVSISKKHGQVGTRNKAQPGMSHLQHSVSLCETKIEALCLTFQRRPSQKKNPQNLIQSLALRSILYAQASQYISGLQLLPCAVKFFLTPCSPDFSMLTALLFYQNLDTLLATPYHTHWSSYIRATGVISKHLESVMSILDEVHVKCFAYDKCHFLSDCHGSLIGST